jgi:hypothetical protein
MGVILLVVGLLIMTITAYMLWRASTMQGL